MHNLEGDESKDCGVVEIAVEMLMGFRLPPASKMVTVAGSDDANLETLQCVSGRLDSSSRSPQKVHPTQNGVNSLCPCDSRHVFQ
jgi:hypothetical protein